MVLHPELDASSRSSSPQSIAFEWLGTFISDLESSDTPDGLTLENSFVDDSYWRDLLAFTPDYRTLYTRQRIQQYLSRSVAVARPTRFDILPDVRFKDAGGDKTFVQGIVQFQTVIAVCTGVFTLVQSDLGKWKAWCFVTIMDGLHGVADHYLNRNGSMALSRPFERKDVMQYKAVVLGAGQCGLAVAARLKNAGVSTLVLEKSNAVGNSWRTRYKSLETNTPRVFNNLPFYPFPDSAGEHTPCARVADHLDNYHKVLGLHLLTSVHTTTSYDARTQMWTILVIRPNETPITVTCNYLIVATGIGTLKSEVPFIPYIPGKASFRGVSMHSSQYLHSCTMEGQNAIVIGAGCSGHDISQDLALNGSQVTLVQRSSTAVVSRDAMRRSFRGYFAPDILPIDIADRFYIAIPFKAVKSNQNEIATMNDDVDKDLRDGLAARGYLLPGPSDNFVDRLVIRRGGYYIERGCASLITSGKISVKAGVEISRITPSGVAFADGSQLAADLIIFATGFTSTTIKEAAENLFGSKIAESVNDLGAWDEDWEFAGIWRPLGRKYQGLWFAEGDLFTARFYSQLLALQIKARELGLLTPSGDRYLPSCRISTKL